MYSLWFIHIMESYSAIKRIELLIDATTWMDLKSIMLSKKKKADTKVYILCHCNAILTYN